MESLCPAKARRLALLLGVGFEGGVAVLALGLGWLFDRNPLDHVQWTQDGLLEGTAAALPLLAFFTLLWRWPIGPMERIEKLLNEFFRPLFAPCTLLDLAMISLLAGVGEELLFRGLLQTWLAEYLGPWTNLLCTNLLFGLMHPITPAYVVLAGVMGVYLGWLFLATDNLLTPIVAHGLYDFIMLVYFLRFRPPAERKSSGPPT